MSKSSKSAEGTGGGLQGKVHGFRRDAQLRCGEDPIWEGCNGQGKNLNCGTNGELL